MTDVCTSVSKSVKKSNKNSGGSKKNYSGNTSVLNSNNNSADNGLAEFTREPPPGSEELGNYSKGLVVRVYDEGKRRWVDGQVRDVIRFTACVNVRFSGITKLIRIDPNLLRLKP